MTIDMGLIGLLTYAWIGRSHCGNGLRPNLQRLQLRGSGGFAPLFPCIRQESL